jgi:hypothetical protein
LLSGLPQSPWHHLDQFDRLCFVLFFRWASQWMCMVKFYQKEGEHKEKSLLSVRQQVHWLH